MEIDLSIEIGTDLYEDHTGYGAYPSNNVPEFCDQCNDVDQYLGHADTLADVKEILNNAGYDDDYFQDFVKNYFGDNE